MAGVTPRSRIFLANHAATGVFPVPPTVRFPTLSTGTENSSAGNTPQSYNKPRNAMPALYKTSAGPSRRRRTRPRLERPPQISAIMRRRSATRRPQRFAHQLLESSAFFRCSSRRFGQNLGWLSVGHHHASEWLRNHELIPAAQMPGPVRYGDDGEDERVRSLRGDQRAGGVFMSRSARAVGRNRDLIPRLKRTYDRDQRATRAARCRSAYQPEAERLSGTRHELSITVLADQNQHALMPVKPEQRQQMPVPQRINECRSV